MQDRVGANPVPICDGSTVLLITPPSQKNTVLDAAALSKLSKGVTAAAPTPIEYKKLNAALKRRIVGKTAPGDPPKEIPDLKAGTGKGQGKKTLPSLPTEFKDLEAEFNELPKITVEAYAPKRKIKFV